MTANDSDTARKQRRRRNHRLNSTANAVAETSPRSSLKENALIEMPAKTTFVLPHPTHEILRERGTLGAIAFACAVNERLEKAYRLGRYHLLAWAFACAKALQETPDDWDRFIEDPWWQENNTSLPRKSHVADALYFVLLRIFGPGQSKQRSKYLAILTRFGREGISPSQVVREIRNRGGIEKTAYPPGEASIRARSRRDLAAADDEAVRDNKRTHRKAHRAAAKHGAEPPLEIALDKSVPHCATATENGLKVTLKVDDHQLTRLDDHRWHALNVKVRLRASGELQLRGPFFGHSRQTKLATERHAKVVFTHIFGMIKATEERRGVPLSEESIGRFIEFAHQIIEVPRRHS